MSGRALLWASMCGALAVPALAQPVVSLDGSRTGDELEPGGDRYLTAPAMASATSSLLASGFTISITDRFLPANTVGARVLYTGAVDTDFTAAEIAHCLAFVNAGGGLIIQRDFGTFYPAADPLLAAFGVSINTAGIGIAGQITDVLDTTGGTHPIWNGPAGSTSSYGQGFSSSIASGATIIGAHGPGFPGSGTPALGVLNVGAGRVIILTDMDAWDEDDPAVPTLGSPNGIVWVNMFHFAAVPAPGSAALLGLGGLVAARRRRR